VTAEAGRSRDLIIVSAADNGYFPLLRDNVLSVRALDADVPVGVLDLGLTAEQIDWLSTAAVEIVKPGWDVTFPGQERMPDVFKAQVARPFLPRHFPGHEMYFWLDADAWLQDWRAVNLYCAAAGRHRIAITVEIDRAYKRHYKRPKLFGMDLAWKCYRAGFGWRVADRLGRNPIANCGVFALHRDAPHWEAWARVMTGVLQRTRFFFAEQIALNYAIFAEKLPANFLPAYCNWTPGDAAPAFDAAHGLFVEPYAPHEVIGVMHLAGADAKNKIFRLDCVAGGTVETSLRYSESRAVCRGGRETAPLSP
jgi:hypothetical protein